MNKQKVLRIIYSAFVLSTFAISSAILYYGIINGNGQDFEVFYKAGTLALTGKSIYFTTGESSLPFWLLPWAAWFYIPFAILPKAVSLLLYGIASILCCFLSINSLTKYYKSDFELKNKVLMFSLTIPMSYLLIFVCQMDYMLLGLVVLTMYAIKNKDYLSAGALLPFVWIKPHLMIIFTLFAFFLGGKRIILISIGFSAIMLIVETLISPGWHHQMLNLLQAGTQRTDYRWNFTTLPALLGFHENWVGTGNLLLTIPLILMAGLIVWKFRNLPVIPLLSLAATASLFCAPRAFAYDLPLLIPALIWLTADNFKATFWIWLAASIIPFSADYSSGAYLLTLLIFILAIGKSYKLQQYLNRTPVQVS